MRSKVHSLGVRNIQLENLQQAIIIIKEQDDKLVVAAEGSPFTWDIHEAPLLEGFKLPKIKAYEEEVDPQDHFDTFND